MTSPANRGNRLTGDAVATRIGVLTFEKGFPTEETARKVFDEIDYQRAVQAYLWAYPVVSFESIRLAAAQHLGADFHDVLIADKFADPGGLWLTANDSTIYALTNVDLGQSGPVVVDVPPGLLVGLINDFWQRSIADVGLPGPDGDKGGKFVLVPPGYTGDIPVSGYHVVKAPLHNYNVMVRGILRGGMDNAPETVQTVKQLRVYPLSERANPKATRFISISGVEIQSSSGDAAHSSYDNLKPSADGSIDLYFWPKAPAGMENNWIETVPGKGWYPMIRFYTSKEGLFDGTWTLPDVELTN